MTTNSNNTTEPMIDIELLRKQRARASLMKYYKTEKGHQKRLEATRRYTKSEKGRKKIKECNKRYYYKDVEQSRARSRIAYNKYYQNNKHKKRSYYQTNKVKILAQRKEYYKKKKLLVGS